MKRLTLDKKTKEKLLYALKMGLSWFIIVLSWAVIVALFVAMLIVPFWIIIFPTLLLILKLIIVFKHRQFNNLIEQNVIIHGGRGKGKGLLFQFSILNQKKVLSNVPFGENTTILNPSLYFNSIKPNDTDNMINDKVSIVKKVEEWENVPYYLDDTAVYFPNYNDTQLKKIYPSMSLFIPIQRHLYDTYTVINVQDINRVYKILRELQTDGYIKALQTIGKGYIMQRLPYLRKRLIVKYRYHENLESAINNRLPFSKMGIINRSTDSLYTSSASAMKESYNGQNGEIKDGFIIIKRKDIKYDTRYFHEKLFGYKANN